MSRRLERRLTAVGRDVTGSKNPNWKGGLVDRVCHSCGKRYMVKSVHSRSKYCSMQCVGISQRGVPRKRTELKVAYKTCEVCDATYTVPLSHEHRHHCCSKQCSFRRRSAMSIGDLNPNWSGGVSRLPYPWNFRSISKSILSRDGCTCQNPLCDRKDKRMTAHHINYNKQDCDSGNLITLCSSCNSSANSDRAAWQAFYKGIMQTRGLL